jgi:hypothetical protein
MESIYPYHPELTLTHDYKRGGYAHNLTVPQKQVLAQLEEWVREELIDMPELNKFAVHPTLTLLRYLRASQFDLTKTVSRIHTNRTWRRIHNVNDISSLNPQSILEVPMIQVMNIFPHWHCGYDKFGRPVLYKQYSLFDITRLKELVGMQRLERYHIWEQEQCMILCEIQSHKRKLIVETCVAVLDLEGMKISQVTSDFIAMVKSMADVDSNQYPETLGAIYIINAPSAFPFVWRMVKNFLDPAVASKISIFSSNKKEWQPVLIELIGVENMPANYGGSLDPLTQDRHPYEESMLTLGLDNSRHAIHSGENMQEEDSDEEYKTVDDPFVGGRAAITNTRRYRNLEGRIMIDITAHDTADANDTDSNDGNIYVDALDSESKIRALNFDYAEDISDGEVDDPSLHRFSLNQMLARLSTEQLNKLLIGFITVYTLIALQAMGFSAYVVSTKVWISEYAKVQLWTGIVVLLVSVVIIFSNFIGLMGIYYKNRLLVKIFGVCSFLGMLVFLVVATACFLYAANPRFAGWSNSVIHKTFQADSGRARQLITHNQIIVGSCSLTAAIISVGPIAVSYMLNRRMRRILGAKLSVDHVRWAMRVSIYVSFMTAGIMLVYGGSALQYLMTIDYSPAMFPVYGLIYGGITMILISVFGLWASYTSDSCVLTCYFKYLLTCLTLLLMSATFVSIASMPKTASDLSKKYSAHSVVASRVQTELLVATVICTFASVFQFVSMYSSRALVKTIEQDRQDAIAGIQRANNNVAVPGPLSLSSIPRGWLEKCIISWSLVYGLYLIYFDGTFVVFSSFAQHAADSKNGGSWVNTAWYILGQLDRRFLSNDGFVVSSSAMLAVVVGPLLLLYAWCLFVRASFRGAVGIIASIFLLYSSILYWGIEIHNNFADFSRKYSAALIVMFLFTSMSSIVLPSYVLYREIILVKVFHRSVDPFSSSVDELEGLLANDEARDCAGVGRRGGVDRTAVDATAEDLHGARSVQPRGFFNQLEFRALSPALFDRYASRATASKARMTMTGRASSSLELRNPTTHEQQTPMTTWMNDPNSPGRRNATTNRTRQASADQMGGSSSSSCDRPNSNAVLPPKPSSPASAYSRAESNRALVHGDIEMGDIRLAMPSLTDLRHSTVVDDRPKRIKGHDNFRKDDRNNDSLDEDEDHIIIRIPKFKGPAKPTSPIMNSAVNRV